MDESVMKITLKMLLKSGKFSRVRVTTVETPKTYKAFV